MRIFDNKDISVMCPNCGKFLLKADKRDTRKNQIKCKCCEKLITYIPAKPNFHKVDKVPERTTSSGARFW